MKNIRIGTTVVMKTRLWYVTGYKERVILVSNSRWLYLHTDGEWRGTTLAPGETWTVGDPLAQFTGYFHKFEEALEAMLNWMEKSEEYAADRTMVVLGGSDDVQIASVETYP